MPSTGIFMSTIIQLGFVLIVAGFFYVVFDKRKSGFSSWIGLYLPKNSNWAKSSFVVFVASPLIMLGPVLFLQYLGDITPEMLYNRGITGQGLSVGIVSIILLRAVFQTSLSEEIFFRGLIGKRVANKFGYLTGNITQALLFGLPHGLPFMIAYGEYVVGATFILATGIVGYLLFWLKEKKAEGSLMPSILVHAVLNVISFTLMALG